MIKKFTWLACLFLSLPAFGQFRFVENQKQWDAQARYRAELPGGYLYLENNALTYLFYDPSSFPQHQHGDEDATHVRTNQASGVRGHVVKAHFLGANAQPSFQTAKTTPEYYNFLLGNDQSKWAHKVKAYEEVSYKKLYDNIDLKFYNHKEDLKYEFIVHPHGQAKNIRIQYEGQDNIYLEDGHLYVKTSVNAFREAKPYCYQLIDGLELEIESEYRLEDDVLSFHFPHGYDSNHPLIIDPTLIFSTFSGSFQNNWGFTATPDDDGHLYAGGMAYQSGTFPTTTGAFQETAPSGGSSSTDIAIIKYTPDGTGIVYATYLGGIESDLPHSLIVNSQNQLVIMGSTSSNDFPMAATPYDNSFNGGGIRNINGLTFGNGTDMFIAVLNEAGSDLVGSTFFGGSDNDGLNPDDNFSDLTYNYGDEFRGDMILDENDNIYICSVTESADFPTTNNVIQRNLLGDLDAVVAKFNADLSVLFWSTYLGGTNDESAYGIKLNENNEVIVTGGTQSINFPSTAGVLHETFRGGSTDGFITIINTTGTAIIASTFLGTDQFDQSYLLDTDEDGNIAVFGQTLGLYPVSADSLYQNPKSGQFIHKLSPDLSTTILSTVVGGGSPFTNIAQVNIRPTAFLINSCSQIYLAGWGGIVNGSYPAGGNTNDLPVTNDAYKSTTDGSDFYLMILSSDATRLIYATYFGGNSSSDGDHVDGGTSRFDKKGVVYQAVCACRSNNFPTTPGVVSNTNNSSGGCNNAAFKFDFQGINADINPTVPDDNGIFVPGDEGCAPLQVIFSSDSLIGDEFTWDFGDGTTITANRTDVQHTYTVPGEYIVTVSVEDSSICQLIDMAVDTITVFEADFTVSGDVTICEGESTQLVATGGNNYQWSPITGLDDPTSATPTASPSVTTTYTVEITNAFGCDFEDNIQVTIQELNSAFDTTWLTPCDTFPSIQINTESNSTQQNYNWFLNGQPFNPSNSQNFIFDPKVAGNYQLILQTENNGCTSADTIDFELLYNADATSLLNVELSDEQTICQGETVPLFVNGGTSYLWSPAGSLDDPTSATPIATPDVTTDYQIEVFTNKVGCSLDTNLLITVIPEVTLDFGYEWSEAECGEFPTVSFYNRSTGTEIYTWNINGQEFIGRIPPEIEATKEDTFKVILTGGDPLCAKTDSIEVPVNQFGTPPNAFSPNGDGINDTFEIQGLGDGWHLIIYDRWGKKVFESENYHSEWAGGNNGGETFYYLLTSPSGATCKGYIHVLKGPE